MNKPGAQHNQNDSMKCPFCFGMHRIGARFCPKTGKTLDGSTPRITEKKLPAAPGTLKMGEIPYPDIDKPVPSQKPSEKDKTNEMDKPKQKKKFLDTADSSKLFGEPFIICPGCDSKIPLSRKSKFCNNCGRLLDEKDWQQFQATSMTQPVGQMKSFVSQGSPGKSPAKQGTVSSAKPPVIAAKPGAAAVQHSRQPSSAQPSIQPPAITTPGKSGKVVTASAVSGKQVSAKKVVKKIPCPYPQCTGGLLANVHFCPTCYRRIRACPRCKTPNPIKEEKCKSCSSVLPKPDPADWLMFKGDPERTGNSIQSIKPDLMLRWKYPEPKNAAGLTSSPVVYRGMVYFGATDQHLHALNQYNGNVVWKRPTKGFILSTPAVWENVIYAASCDGRIYAQDVERGKPVWVYPHRTAMLMGPITAPLLVCSAGVIVATDHGLLLCLEHASGKRKWTKEFDASIVKSENGEQEYSFFGGVACAEGKVFASDRAGRVTCLDAETGKELWKFPPEGKTVSAFVGTPACAAGTCYVPDRAGRIYALSAATGNDTWNYTVDVDGVVEGSPAVGFGRVILGTQTQYLVALDMHAGGEAWRERNEKIRLVDAIFSTPTITLNELVFVGSNSGYIYCRSVKDGEEIWKYKLDSPIRTAPAVSDGFLYVTTTSGFLNAFCEKRIVDSL